MNWRITRPSLHGLLAAFLVLLLLHPVSGGPGLGTSQHNPHVTLAIGESKTVSIGRLYNIGDVTLNITADWYQQYGDILLSINVTPKMKILPPEESYEIYITAKGLHPGYSYGTVEVIGRRLATEPGNPICPGGSFPANITILNGQSQNQTQNAPDYEEQPIPMPITVFPLYAMLLFTAGIVGCLFIYLKFIRKRGHLFPRAGK